ncbi:MAG TPA: 2-dehydropantoate 2-reductase [Nitrospirota bacterium]|nr:2-dehydropantoate 2-reductase [Nitrospirota bacterium]
MKVAVIGAGAIGSVTAALLSDKGHDVTLLCRPEQAGAINARGLHVGGIGGGKVYEVPARPALDFSPDFLLLAVKTQDVHEACCAAMPHAGDAVAVTMQNGLKSDGIAASVLGRERIVSSVVMFGATCDEPGRVTYNFPGGLVIGKAFDDGADGVVERAGELFSGALDVRIADDIHAAHRTKLVLNLNNALAGILGQELQTTFSDARVCRLGLALMREACETMEAAGLSIGELPGLPLEKLKSLLQAPPDVGAQIYGGIMRGLSKEPLPGSVLQSIRRGRRSEIDYLNGEVVSIGNGCGHPAPLNARAVAMVQKVEEAGRFFDAERLIEEMAL